MSSGDHFTSTVDHRFHSFKVFFPSQFVYSHNCRGHRTDQHFHPFCLRTAVQNICTHAKVILGNSLIGTGKLTSLIYNANRYPRHFFLFLTIAQLTDNIPEQGCFPPSWRRNDQSMGYPVFFADIGHHLVCAAYHFVSQTYIDTGNIFHSLDLIAVKNHLSGNTYPMTSLNSKKPLAHFIFIGIKGITTYIFHGFLQIFPCHHVFAIMVGKETLTSVIGVEQRPSYS